MKKILPLAMFAIILSLGSCSKSPGDAAIDILESYTSKIEKVSTEEELEKLQKEFTADWAALEAKYSKEKLESVDKDEEKVKKLKEATSKLAEVAAKKKAELDGSNSSNDE